jgi:hypothetical protein
MAFHETAMGNAVAIDKYQVIRAGFSYRFIQDDIFTKAREAVRYRSGVEPVLIFKCFNMRGHIVSRVIIGNYYLKLLEGLLLKRAEDELKLLLFAEYRNNKCSLGHKALLADNFTNIKRVSQT